MIIMYCDPETGNTNIDYVESVSCRKHNQTDTYEVTIFLSAMDSRLVMSNLSIEAKDIVMHNLFKEDRIDISEIECNLSKLNIENPNTASSIIPIVGYIDEFTYPDDDDCYE